MIIKEGKMIPKKLKITFPILVLFLAVLLLIYKSRADQLDLAVKPVAAMQAQQTETYIDTKDTIKTALYHNKVSSSNLDFIGISTLIAKLNNMYGSEGITTPVILGMIETESNFRPDAVGYDSDGKSFSYGLMQITTKTARPIIKFMNTKGNIKEALFDPITNIMVGTAILHECIMTVQRHGISPEKNLDYALGVYNMGVAGFFNSMQHGHPGITATRYIAKQHKNQKHWANLVKKAE